MRCKGGMGIDYWELIIEAGGNDARFSFSFGPCIGFAAAP